MAELLLVSRWLDAVPAFVAAHTSRTTAEPVRLAFVPTASSIYPDRAWVDYDRRTLRGFGYAVDDVHVEHLSPDGLAHCLDDTDVVFVSGGNVFHLLSVLRRTGFDRLLTDRVRAGMPYIGASAGAGVVGADIGPLGLLDDPEVAPDMSDTTGLGWIDEVVVPHADGIVVGKNVIDEIGERYAADHTLRFLTDDQALLVSGDSRSVIAS
ncbi:Type 1 glutamine amidotransferase-like domain-containing protein [Gordonia sp. CPCC 206044]|uniref:Type 1 glutamine amidotransferase-like domain-containing protein n=1 Tax=Gordonia sp. CPCC 206044 TaxID=3140793 RepID=UPI003AF3B2DB